MRVICLLFLTVLIYGCKPGKTIDNQFSKDLDFLRANTETVVLEAGSSSLVIAPEWQARVMTSTADRSTGDSYGWINYGLIESREILPHINPFGGEERMWLGPEGGQYSLFFNKGDSFDYDNWQTPAIIDSKAFETLSQNDSQAEFYTESTLTNYSGYTFNFRINRKISILDITEIKSLLDFESEELKAVAYTSENKLTNTGEKKWVKDSGLISIWMLGMFNPSPSTTVIIPYIEGPVDELGPEVNDNYFGSVPADRLKYSNGIILFKSDGKERGKIGIGPLRASGIMGSYDSDKNTLTLLICNLPEGITEYVNSAWEIQDSPYSGDAYNSYNDGPLDDGSIMGPFYELETSSPALSLDAGESYTHVQTTIHLSGPVSELNKISKKHLGVDLNDISL